MRAVMLIGLGLLIAACGSLRTQEEPVEFTATDPEWSDERIEEHLLFFTGAGVEERATGTVGFTVAASYVAARMREFGLQPGLENSWEISYRAPSYEILSARLVIGEGEELALGTDYLPDGRSDAGHVKTPSVVPVGVDEDRAGVFVLMGKDDLSTPQLRQLRDEGARAILLAGPLRPKVTPDPIRDLLVMQILPDIAERLSAEVLVELEITSQMRWLEDAYNIFGYTAGRDPILSSELVLVCADLDAAGAIAGVSLPDRTYLGAGTAALLEMARQYALFASFGSVPGRTLLYGVFSGARQGYAGLQDYLRRPLWPLSRTHAIVYLGADPADQAVLHSLVEPTGVPLHIVLPTADIGAAEEMSDIEMATIEARSIVEDAHTILLRQASSRRAP